MSASPRRFAVPSFRRPGGLLAAALALAGSFLAAPAAPKSRVAFAWPGARPAANLTVEENEFLDEMERASFRFFTEQSHPVTGLVRDRARADGSPSDGKASIATSGFALSAWVIATERGWVGWQEALDHVKLMLRFLAEKAPRQHGFFYHFMDMDTGARAWQCELSSIDTALFLAGAIVAREYFQDPEVTELVNGLYHDMDWQWFLNGGRTMALSWHDETGFSRYRWMTYSEHLMMSFLALGSPTHPLDPDYWREWARVPTGDYAGYHYIQQPPLFIHQFTHAYVDFRGRRDAYADYYHNSMLATLAQRQFCADLRNEFPSWSERLWGLTSSDSASGYKGGWGGPPRTLKATALDGTIAPCAAAGSLPFAPYETMLTLRHMRMVYGDRIWQRYGFVDAFNPQTGWVDPDVIGIDQGITMLQAENTRTGFIWALFMQAPEVQQALRTAGLVSKSRELSFQDSDRLKALAVQGWTAVARAPAAPATIGLQITSVLAAHALGAISTDEAIDRARTLLEQAVVPAEEGPLAHYAASLITLRQALPVLADEATRRFQAIDWSRVNLRNAQLGSASRLAAFFMVATGARSYTAWSDLTRDTVKVGPVYVLAPAKVADQFVPGLWLDEQSIITGASAAQLAYAALIAESEHGISATGDVLGAALLLDRYPAEAAARLKSGSQTDRWLAAAPLADQAAFLITVANVLVPDCTRQWFQQDSLVQTGRTALREFADAAFGKNTSLTARYELRGPQPARTERRALVLPAGTPREKWDWQRMADLSFKDSAADVRPGDPPLEMRFAFTWDAEALHFHAEVVDTPPGYTYDAGRNRFVELFLNPRNDGLRWLGADDFQYYYCSDGQRYEWFHHNLVNATITPTPTGYTVESSIPWRTLRLQPEPGLEFGASPAVMDEGAHEWEPALKYTWCYQSLRDSRIRLGLLKLQ